MEKQLFKNNNCTMQAIFLLTMFGICNIVSGVNFRVYLGNSEVAEKLTYITDRLMEGNSGELNGGSAEAESERPLLAKCCLRHQVLNDDGVCIHTGSTLKEAAWYPEKFFNLSTESEDFTHIDKWQVVEPFQLACQDGWIRQVQHKFMLTTLGAFMVSAPEPDVISADEFCVDQQIDNIGPVLVSCKRKSSSRNTFSKCCPPQTVVRSDLANLTCIIPMQQDFEEYRGYHYTQGAPKCSAEEYTYSADIENNFTIADDGSLLLPSYRVPASKYCIDFFQDNSHSSDRKLQVLMCLSQEVLVKPNSNSSASSLEVKFVLFFLTLGVFTFSGWKQILFDD